MQHNQAYETTMRVAFINSLASRPWPGTALDRLVFNKLKAGVGVRWPRRGKK